MTFGDAPLIAAGLLCIGIATARADTGTDTPPAITPCGPVSAISGLMQPPADPTQYWRAPDAPALVDVRPLPPVGGHVHKPDEPAPIPVPAAFWMMFAGCAGFALAAWRMGRKR